jgi:putative membrane protein
VRGFWGYFLPLDLTMSTSMLYELVEWLSAEVFGSGLGAAFLAEWVESLRVHRLQPLGEVELKRRDEEAAQS